MQALTRIESCFGVEISVRHFFEQPTVDSLAVTVNELRALRYSDEELTRLLAEVESMADNE